MLKAVTYETGIFKFTENVEKDIPKPFYTDQDFHQVGDFLTQTFGPKTFSDVLIGNYVNYLKNNPQSKFDAFTNTETKIIYLPMLTSVNRGGLYNKGFFLGNLLHEVVHVISNNYSDIFLATTIGRWFEFNTFNRDFMIGDVGSLEGKGSQAVLNKALSKDANKIFLKIKNSNPKNKAIIEKKYGYKFGNYIFDIMLEAKRQAISDTKINSFVSDLFAGKSLEESFIKLMM